jgi:C2 domain
LDFQERSCGRVTFLPMFLQLLLLFVKFANGIRFVPIFQVFLVPEIKGMKKFETKVHRKTLNPFFNETFQVEKIIKKLGDNPIVQVSKDCCSDPKTDLSSAEWKNVVKKSPAQF